MSLTSLSGFGILPKNNNTASQGAMGIYLLPSFLMYVRQNDALLMELRGEQRKIRAILTQMSMEPVAPVAVA